jgi:hypothetical protein
LSFQKSSKVLIGEARGGTLRRLPQPPPSSYGLIDAITAFR